MSILVHIGFHKTASSWLQEEVFGRHPAFELCFSQREIYENLVWPHRLDFAPERAQRFFAPRLRSAEEKGRVAVVSSERLSGSPFAGGRDSADNADRLAALFPEARVLVVVREQRSAIASTYRQYVSQGGTASPAQFFDFDPLAANTWPYYWFHPDHFRYDRLIAYYQARFGADRVLVAFYEAIRRDLAGFGRSIAAFAGAEPADFRAVATGAVHRSLSDASIGVLRLANRWHRSPANPYPLVHVPGLQRLTKAALRRADPLLRAVSRPAALDRAIRERYGSFFGESNRLLAERTGTDLTSLGYS